MANCFFFARGTPSNLWRVPIRDASRRCWRLIPGHFLFPHRKKRPASVGPSAPFEHGLRRPSAGRALRPCLLPLCSPEVQKVVLLFRTQVRPAGNQHGARLSSITRASSSVSRETSAPTSTFSPVSAMASKCPCFLQTARKGVRKMRILNQGF